MPHGEGEHLAENDFDAFGCGGSVFGDVAEQPVESPDGGLADTEVAEGGQDRGAQAGLVAVDGLDCDPFFGGDLLDPQVGEGADAGLPADLVVVGGAAVADLDLQCPGGGGSGGAGDFDVAGDAVVVAEADPGAESARAQFLGADLAGGADGQFRTGRRSPVRVGVLVEPPFDFAAPVAQGVADADGAWSLASAVPGVEGVFRFAQPGGEVIDGQERIGPPFGGWAGHRPPNMLVDPGGWSVPAGPVDGR